MYVWIVAIAGLEWFDVKYVCETEEKAKEKWDELRQELLQEIKKMQRNMGDYWGYSLNHQLDFFGDYQYYRNLTLKNVDDIETYLERPVIKKFEVI